MFRIRFSSFLYVVIVLVLLHGNASIAQALEDMEKKPEFAGSVDYERVSALTNEEKTYDEFLTRVEEKNQKQRGRKILSSKADKEKQSNGEVSNCASPATPSIGRKEKGFLNEKCRSLSKKGDPVESNMAGFEALNADYYLPRHHPPKNN